MHRLLQNSFLFLLILQAVAFLPAYSEKLSKKTKGLEIVQKSEVNGLNKIVITKDAAKIICKNAGYSLIMLSPDWKVTAFSTSKKNFYTTDWKNFKLDFDYGSSIVRKARYNQMKVKKTIGYQQIKGFKSLHISRRNYTRANQRKNSTTGILNVARVDFWLVKENQIPKPVAQVVQNLYRLPKLDGYPLVVSYTTTGDKKCQDVALISVRRKFFGQNRFKLPKNYKKANKLSEVMLDMADAETMIEMLLGN